MPSKKVPVHQEHQNVTIFGERVFAGVTKVRMEMKSYWIKAGYKSNEGVLREEGNVKTEAGTVVMHLQDRDPKESLKPAETGERHGVVSLSESPGGINLPTLWPPEL